MTEPVLQADTIGTRSHSSFLAYARSRGLKEADAIDEWNKMPEAERGKFITQFWESKKSELDEGGRIHRKQKSSRLSRFFVILGMLVCFAGIGYIIYMKTKLPYTNWDWPVHLLNATYEELPETIIESRSVMLLEREEPFEQNMELGKGIDLTNNVLTEAVNYEGEIQGLSQPEMKTFLEIVSEENQKSNIVKEMARAQIPTKGLGGGIEYLSGVESNSTSMYIIMATSVTSKKMKIKNPDLKPVVKAIIANISLANFISLYGTHYISGYTNAAQFIGIIELKTETKESKDQIKTMLNSTGFPQALASLEVELQNYHVSVRKNVRMYVQGANIQKIPMGIQELLAAHEEFISETRKAVSMPVSVTCSPYSTLPSIQLNQPLLDAFKGYSVFLMKI